jgi:hypothetical protein
MKKSFGKKIVIAALILFGAGFVSSAFAAVTVGGYIKLDYITRDKPADLIAFGGNLDSSFNGFTCCTNIYAPQDGTAAAEDNRTTVLFAGESRLTFLVTDVGAPKGAKGRTFLEFDFANDASGTSQQKPRLRQAYAEMEWPNFKLTFGQHYTLFAPVFSETVDFDTGLGFGWAFNRVPTFRATVMVPMGEGTKFSPPTVNERPFGTQPRLEFSIAAERPGTRFSDAPYGTASITYSNGNILGTGVAWGAPQPFFLIVSGVIGEGEIGTYTTSPPSHSEDPKYDVTGAAFTASIPLVGSRDGTRAMTVTFLGQYWTGEALGDYFLTGFTNTEGQWTGDPTNTNEVEGDGGYASLQFWPTENFAIIGVYEWATLDEITDPATGMILANFPDKSEKWVASARWVITPWIWAQLEGNLLRTDYENPSPGLDDDGDAVTIQAALYWFF